MSKSPKITPEMITFEKETGKKAIWQDRITEAFKKWKRGEKIYETAKKRIVILVEDDTKDKWEAYSDENETTISNLIRESVEFWIGNQALINEIEDVNKFTHSMKEPLTSIKGFSQLIKSYVEKLTIRKSDSKAITKIINFIEKIANKSNSLEDRINSIMKAGESIEQPKISTKPSKEDYEILIVEDDISTMELLVEYFDLEGYKCKGVNSGKMAFMELQNVRPLLILMDIMLPDIDGNEVCKEIKDNEKFYDIPVYFITALPESEILRFIEETGADGFILKPFELTELEVLNKHLKRA